MTTPVSMRGRGGKKLNPDQVHEIRRRWVCGEPQAAIASAYNVTATTVWAIVNRTIWTHLEVRPDEVMPDPPVSARPQPRERAPLPDLRDTLSAESPRCARGCGVMQLDLTTLRRSELAGVPAPAVYYCPNGHSERALGGAAGDVAIPRAWWDGYLVSIGEARGRPA